MLILTKDEPLPRLLCVNTSRRNDAKGPMANMKITLQSGMV